MAEGADVTPSTPLTLLGSDANGNDISIGSLAVTVRAVDAVSALIGHAGRSANARPGTTGPGSANLAVSANPYSKELSTFLMFPMGRISVYTTLLSVNSRFSFASNATSKQPSSNDGLE